MIEQLFVKLGQPVSEAGLSVAVRSVSTIKQKDLRGPVTQGGSTHYSPHGSSHGTERQGERQQVR
jgi:hypothetical protein